MLLAPAELESNGNNDNDNETEDDGIKSAKKNCFIQEKTAEIEQEKQTATICTNQQPPQRGGAVPDPVWVGSKWLLASSRVPVTPGTPHSFFCYAAP